MEPGQRCHHGNVEGVSLGGREARESEVAKHSPLLIKHHNSVSAKKIKINNFYLHTFHNIEFSTSHTSIGAVEKWAWHGEVDLGESGDDSILPIDAVCPGKETSGGTATKDVLLICSCTKVVGRIRLTISAV